jgi:hypothetical protein
MVSEAGLKANLDYWKNVADRYRQERDAALREAELVREILLRETGKAYDGDDWLREIARTKTSNGVWRWIKSFF